MSPTAPPGPRPRRLMGSLPRFQSDPIGLFMDSTRDFGDVVGLRFGPRKFYFLRHPDHVERVLLTNHRNYGRQTLGWKHMRTILGQGLLTSEGELWLRQRRIAQPAFHRERIAGFARLMTKAAEDMLSGWEAASRAGAPIDAASEMMRLALRIVGETLLGTDVAGESALVAGALPVALHQVMSRMASPYSYLPLKVPTPENRKYKTALRTLDGVIGGIIKRRRRGEGGTPDLLSMLMESRDEETGQYMDDAQLRDEVMTMFLAGHETTANALAWTWYLLSLHPEVERKLSAEHAAVLAGRTPGLLDLPRLPYTKMVFQEALRLYPPAWFTTRSVIADDEMGGYRLRAGGTVMLSSYVTHRHRAFWDNPEGFDPERFAPGRREDAPRFAYFPFSGGPRQCIGNEFAMMEAQLILATVSQRYRLELVPGHRVEADPQVTLRPRHGMLMTLRPR